MHFVKRYGLYNALMQRLTDEAFEDDKFSKELKR